MAAFNLEPYGALQANASELIETSKRVFEDAEKINADGYDGGLMYFDQRREKYGDKITRELSEAEFAKYRRESAYLHLKAAQKIVKNGPCFVLNYENGQKMLCVASLVGGHAYLPMVDLEKSEGLAEFSEAQATEMELGNPL